MGAHQKDRENKLKKIPLKQEQFEIKLMIVFDYNTNNKIYIDVYTVI